MLFPKPIGNTLPFFLNLLYVNNIQITWKTIHLSVFYWTNSPSIDQSRAEGNNTECVGKKRFKKWKSNGGIIGSKAKSYCNGV
jgi:hypothetical protein